MKLMNKKNELDYTLATSYGNSRANGKVYEGSVQNTVSVPQQFYVQVNDGDISLQLVD
ncbi:MAG: hypothetical protein ACI35O_11515 [Bacillaceae bacterium]